jgi:hypothetical protein
MHGTCNVISCTKSLNVEIIVSTIIPTNGHQGLGSMFFTFFCCCWSITARNVNGRTWLAVGTGCRSNILLQQETSRVINVDEHCLNCWAACIITARMSSETDFHCQNSRNRQPTIAIQTANNTRRSVLMFWRHYNFSFATKHAIERRGIKLSEYFLLTKLLDTNKQFY